MKRIFVIEDDDLMREVLTRSLSKHDYDVTGFRTAVQAVEIIETAPPALIVSDVHMPGMTGLELARRIRALEIGVPIILITADVSDDIREEARTLGVARVFSKPLGDMSALANAIACELVPVDVGEEVQRLDELRLGMLTELSHQLRTPITAMRLALCGLFDQLEEDMVPAQRRLVEITRRNIDRIVALVENQLSLLHATLGERLVARRLVDLESLVGEATDGLPVDVSWSGFKTRVHAFTDPDVLGTVLGCIICGTGADHRSRMAVTLQGETVAFDIEVAGCAPPESSGSTNFETRAYATLVKELGGAIEMREHPDGRRVRLELPLEPPFDRDKDFVNTVRTVKRDAESTGRLVSFLSCEMLVDAGMTPGDVMSRCGTMLLRDDTVLRGQEDGLLYLALVDRSSAEIDALTACLGRRPGEAAGERPLVSDASEIFAGA